LFHRHKVNGKVPNPKALKDLTRIVSPKELLMDLKRGQLLDKIEHLSGLEPARFKSMGHVLMNHLINHCQSIPETTNSYFALPGGLLDHALNRTEAALEIFSKFVVQDPSGSLSEEQKLWAYALFSAGILQGIGKLHIDYRVDIYDANGQFLKQWCSLLESLSSVGSYYHFEFQEEGEAILRCRLNLLMARLLMPAEGYAWIVSNQEVLAVWLALLNEDARGAGTLGAILIRADAIAIQRYFNEVLIKGFGGRAGRQNRITTFVDSTPESITEKERILGVEFIKWLTNQLANGKILINKAPLLMVPGGLLMSVEAYQMFVREHPEFKNWQAVQKAFLSLGLHKVGADGKAISRFEQTNNHQMQSGVLISDYAVVLPESVKVYNMNTGEISSVSATELVHMEQVNHHLFHQQGVGKIAGALLHLSSSGTWRPSEGPPPILGVNQHV
jgi:integrating conjugative element relaxase (TIGR03760 family)